MCALIGSMVARRNSVKHASFRKSVLVLSTEPSINLAFLSAILSVEHLRTLAGFGSATLFGNSLTGAVASVSPTAFVGGSDANVGDSHG